jgi:hypothetical protein
MIPQEPPEELRKALKDSIKQFITAINSKEGEEFYAKIQEAINTSSHDLHTMMSVMHAAMWATAMRLGIEQEEYINNAELYTKIASQIITLNCLLPTEEEKN